MSKNCIASLAVIAAFIIAAFNAQAANTIGNSTAFRVNISPLAANISQGQSQTFNVSVLGGAAPYSYAYLVSNTYGVTITNNTITFAYNGTYLVTAYVTDSNGITAYSGNSVISVAAPAIAIPKSNIMIDTGQYITLNSTLSGMSGNVTYQWYNATNSPGTAIPGANSSAYTLTGLSPAQNLTYYVIATEKSTNTVAARSNNAVLSVYPSLGVITDYYPPIINITAPHSFTINALYYVQVYGGTGEYVYSWNTSQLSPNAFVINSSCLSKSQYCTITAANVSRSVSGRLLLSVNDTSSGNASYASTQSFFITANPDPPLTPDYLGRNVSQLMHMPLRIGLITPASGQIVYGLGLGSDVVAVTAPVNDTLPSFGVTVPRNVTNIGLNYDYYLPDYFEELVNASVNYVPVDSGAFEGTLSAGLADFQAAGINAVALGGDFDRNISQVESDIMLVANTTGTASNGTSIVNGMNKIVGAIRNNVSGTPAPTVAMINWYGYGSMYVDGANSFIGSEIGLANAQDMFTGYYPSPSAGQLIAGNPDYIIASIFGAPYDNISTTYASLSSIPGIRNTTAWREGRVYVLGNLATNITDEPGQLSVYGALLYAVILHPSRFGFSRSAIPNNITAEWVNQEIKPNIHLQSPGATTAPSTTTIGPCQACIQGSGGTGVPSPPPTKATTYATTASSSTTTETTTVPPAPAQGKNVTPLSQPAPTSQRTTTAVPSLVTTNPVAPPAAPAGGSTNVLLSAANFIIKLVEKFLKTI